MIRTVFVWFWIVVSGTIFATLCILCYPLNPRRGRLNHRIAGLWGKVSIWANLVRVTVEGVENVPGKGPYVFMSNHQGSYDIFALLGYLPFQFKYLAKEIFSIPILGMAMKATGYISIDREGTRETVKAMNDAAKKIHEGMSVLIFPEGSRSPDGLIQPFKKGGFTLAIKSQVPIVPIAISGSNEIIPKGKMRVYPGSITLRLDRPVETKGCTMRDRETLMDQLHGIILKNFEVISKTGEK